MQENIQATPETLEQKETPERLNAYIVYLQRRLHCASSRKARLEILMRRKSAKKWDASKKAKMVRRLMSSTNELDGSTKEIEKTTLKLQSLSSQSSNA